MIFGTKKRKEILCFELIGFPVNLDPFRVDSVLMILGLKVEYFLFLVELINERVIEYFSRIAKETFGLNLLGGMFR